MVLVIRQSLAISIWECYFPLIACLISGRCDWLAHSAKLRDGRPVLVLDPFGLAPGLPELVWDPIAGCIDPKLAERRAKAFTAGTVKGAVASGSGDAAARFYAGESAKVLQAFFHAAALTGRSLERMLHWVANPSAATEPEEILANHPHAAPFWDGLLRGAYAATTAPPATPSPPSNKPSASSSKPTSAAAASPAPDAPPPTSTTCSPKAERSTCSAGKIPTRPRPH